MALTEKPDCQKCGACCLGIAWNNPPLTFVDVNTREAKAIQRRLPAAIVGAGTFTRHSGITVRELAIKQGRRGRCVALKGTVGRKVSCGIYSVRPAPCRDFTPGDDACLEIRARVLGVA